MTTTIANGAVRFVLSVYVALGCSFLLNGVILAIWLDYGGRANNLPPVAAVVTFFGLFLLIAWRTGRGFSRPINLRRWIMPCLLATVGFVPLLLLPAAHL